MPEASSYPRLKAGDVVLVASKSQSWVSTAIRWGTVLRFPRRPELWRFTHAALVVAGTARDRTTIAEALSEGVRVRVLEQHYSPDQLRAYATGDAMSDGDRQQVTDFAYSVVAARTGYGTWTFAGLAVYCATGTALCVQRAGTAICSGFVADALTRAGIPRKGWSRPPYACMPVHLGLDLDAIGMPAREVIE